MAQRVQTLFIDDLDGSAADATIRFGVDGTDYEIDLNAAHAKALSEALDKYIQAGRRVTGRRSVRGRRATSGATNSAEVRAWARSQGIKVSDRGRIPASVIASFKEAVGA
jgi:hypothetical protein